MRPSQNTAGPRHTRASLRTVAATAVAFLALLLGATLGLVDHEHLTAPAVDLCADEHAGTDLSDKTSLHSASRLHDHECPGCGSVRVRAAVLEESSSLASGDRSLQLNGFNGNLLSRDLQQTRFPRGPPRS